MAGHLLECGAQVSGGYYADPGFKDVPGLARLGYPIAEIDADGHCTITKPPGTGGRIDAHTVKEQLLYEVHDPAAYLTPDVVADIGAARGRPSRRRPRPPQRRARPSAPARPEGQRLPRDRLARRGRDLVRRRRAPRPARASPPTCCASGSPGSAAARRPDRRASLFADDAGEWLAAQRAPATRATCACASPCNHTERGSRRAARARGHGALHLRPGRRRRRAHARCGRAWAPSRACVPREHVPAALPLRHADAQARVNRR